MTISSYNIYVINIKNIKLAAVMVVVGKFNHPVMDNNCDRANIVQVVQLLPIAVTDSNIYLIDLL